ncbi:MAG: hypothetical protein IAE66_05035 [Xanthomonadaceae bacterium]|nr:hypothetical protein [Xanthomonadaceae bacterium]
MNKMKSNALSVAVAMALLSGAAMAQTTPATKTRVYLQTRGETQSAASGGEADMQASLQSNRRVDVLSDPGKPGIATVMGKLSLQLPNGGAIWATEDPQLGEALLNAQGPALVAFSEGRIVAPVRFDAYSNYSGFIERMELVVFAGKDTDLVTPLAIVELPVANVGEVEWDGVLPAGLSARDGDELQYLVRAYGRDGQMDETFPKRMQLARPDEVQRGMQQLADSASRQFGETLDVAQAQSRSQLDAVFGQGYLRVQNIPLRGSRVRLHGVNLPGMSLAINGRQHPVDLEHKMVAEYLLPIGVHRFDIVMPAGSGEIRDTLSVDVTGRYAFFAAIADLTASKNRVSGSIEPIAGEERFDGDLYLEGRLAFYAKGKINGKYLFTAQADTQEREIGKLFSGFLDTYPKDIFRRLDPDLYYPVYGDDSNTYRDVDTQGRFYLRVDWDKNQALWGNFNTGFTGSELTQYSRSLYGGALLWRSNSATPWGEARSQLRGFVSEAQSLPGHSEFIGTGGSLYYLRHTDVLPGSGKVVLEIRDRTTGRVEDRVDLVRGVDYEMDELQGRLLLSRPLSQVTRQNVGTITRDTPLDGFEQRLLVDYEYLPRGFNADETTLGFRGKQWLGDHVAVGATWVDENRAGDDYQQQGVDVTLQAGRGTYLKVEQAKTESTSAPVFFSDNGGFSFTQFNNNTAIRSGTATSVEARANFRELGWSQRESTLSAWWRDVEAGYSTSRYDMGLAVREHGAEWLWQPTDALRVLTRYSLAERGAESFEQAQITADWRIGDNISWTGELRRIDERRATGNASGTLGALKYLQRIGTYFEWYGVAQFTLDDDGGKYADNNAFTLGARVNANERVTLGAEATTGDRGDALLVNAEYRLTPDHSLYGKYTQTTDSTEYDQLFNNRILGGWTLGQRWRLSQQLNVFNESQYLKDRDVAGLTHIFGVDLFPSQGWNLGFTAQKGDLERVSDGQNVDRQAYSVNGGYTSPRGQWSSKLELRQDRGAERRDQWVSTNRLMLKLNDDWRIAARLNYANTDDLIDPLADAKFVEGNVGFSWRPARNTDWALLGKYTYLYDLSTLGQVSDFNVDQRSQVVQFDGIRRIGHRWELAAKYSHREGEVRTQRGIGPWLDSQADFAAIQARYEWRNLWHGLAEYRWLDVKKGGARSGWLVGVDRDIGNHFRLGAGYNFTDFSDDLTQHDYDHRGWFLNVVGYY